VGGKGGGLRGPGADQLGSGGNLKKGVLRSLETLGIPRDLVGGDGKGHRKKGLKHPTNQSTESSQWKSLGQGLNEFKNEPSVFREEAKEKPRGAVCFFFFFWPSKVGPGVRVVKKLLAWGDPIEKLES